jgi:hypothetical protein
LAQDKFDPEYRQCRKCITAGRMAEQRRREKKARMRAESAVHKDVGSGADGGVKPATAQTGMEGRIVGVRADVIVSGKAVMRPPATTRGFRVFKV